MKKITLILCILALLLGTCACAAKKTALPEVSVDAAIDEMISEAVILEEQQHYSDYEVFEEAHQILGTREGDLSGEGTDRYLTVYFATLFGGYVQKDGAFENVGGGFQPAAMVFEKSGNSYTFAEYWVPRDGAYVTEDLEATFPKDVFTLWQSLEATAESHNKTVETLEAQIQEKLAK